MRPSPTLDLPFAEPRNVLSVAALNREARQLIEGAFRTAWVEGEISNLSRPSSGHLYWTLKDANAQVRCAMFRQHARGLKLDLDNGRQVVVKARVSLYEARGEFQLLIEYVEEAGEGALRRKFEELKRRLAAEGLFDPGRKRAPPRVPHRIGIVTSPTGAALRDVLTVLRRRFPAAPVLIYPTAVQGDSAAAEISRTLELADVRRDCDVLILARGGGSLEDLWPFNEEIVARTIAALELPVIVGVGHEIDFTIADFVADVRAPTPSQAAELAVPERSQWSARVERLAAQLARAAERTLAAPVTRLENLAHRLYRSHPGVPVRESSQRLDELEARLRAALRERLQQQRLRLAHAAGAIAALDPKPRLAAAAARCEWTAQRLERAVAARLESLQSRLALARRALESLDPLATLARGYAIVSRAADGGVVTDSASVARGTAIDVRLARGRLAATVDASLEGGADSRGGTRKS
jgi:exodeoxyribonuclease VII large subunit